MGMVFQSYSLFPNLNVTANVAFGLRSPGVGKAERNRRVGEMLELVQLEEFATRYPHQLSGGQQQRVALARALAVSPTVLLLDEPLSALDAKVRLLLRDEIRRIQTELGITTLFVTHDQEEALGISDRIGVMSGGRLEQLGSPTEVYRTPASAFVARFVGSMNELAGTVTGPRPGGRGRRDDPDRHRRPVRGRRPRHRVGAAGGRRGHADGRRRRGRDAGPRVSSGSVVHQTFAGACTLVHVRLDRLDELITAHRPSARVNGLEPGTRVAVTVDGERAICEAPGRGHAGRRRGLGRGQPGAALLPAADVPARHAAATACSRRPAPIPATGSREG